MGDCVDSVTSVSPLRLHTSSAKETPATASAMKTTVGNLLGCGNRTPKDPSCTPAARVPHAEGPAVARSDDQRSAAKAGGVWAAERGRADSALHPSAVL